jgi:hypothetical protein
LAIHVNNAVIFFFSLYRIIKLPIYPTAGGTATAILNRFATYPFHQEQPIVEVLRIATLLALLILPPRQSQLNSRRHPAQPDDRCAPASPR